MKMPEFDNKSVHNARNEAANGISGTYAKANKVL
jgi:hypothetical protein